MTLPSSAIVPELLSFGVERKVRDEPCRTSVSNPPAPPSMEPVSAAPCSNTNVSLLSGAPIRFAKPLNCTPPTSPAPAPVTFHVVSAPGPCSDAAPPPAMRVAFVNVSGPAEPPLALRFQSEAPVTATPFEPPPPSNETGTATPASTVSESSPALPVIANADTDDDACELLVPFTVTTRFPPAAATEIVDGAESAIVQTVAAGTGAGP